MDSGCVRGRRCPTRVCRRALFGAAKLPQPQNLLSLQMTPFGSGPRLLITPSARFVKVPLLEPATDESTQALGGPLARGWAARSRERGGQAPGAPARLPRRLRALRGAACTKRGGAPRSRALPAREGAFAEDGPRAYVGRCARLHSRFGGSTRPSRRQPGRR